MYTAATVLTQVITLAATVLVRRFLGPVQTGIWALVQLFIQYANYAGVGIPMATVREIPLALGKGSRDEAERIKNVSVTYLNLFTILISALLLAVAAFSFKRVSFEATTALLIGSVFVVVVRWNNMLINFLRAFQLFSLASKQMVAASIFNAVMVVLLSYRFRIYGFVAAMILSYLFNIVFIMRRHHFHFRFQLDTALLKSLVVYGLPLMTLNLIDTVFLTVDQLMITRFLGLKSLGLYSIAVMSYRYLGTLPIAIGNVMIPHFQETYGKTGSYEGLKDPVLRAARLLSSASPIVIGAAYIVLPPAINFALPQFVKCIPAAQLLLLASFFFTLNYPFNTFVVTVRKHWHLFRVWAVSVVIAVGLNAAMIALGFGIQGVALGTLCAFGVRFILTYQITVGLILNGREGCGMLRGILAKFAILILYLLIIGFLFRDCGQDAKWALMQLVVFVLMYLPFIVKMEKEFGLVRRGLQKIFRGEQTERNEDDSERRS